MKKNDILALTAILALLISGLILSKIPGCAEFEKQGLSLEDCVRAEAGAPCLPGQKICGEYGVVWSEDLAALYSGDDYLISVWVANDECSLLWEEEKE